ncbi:hypothetical protein CDS [Bradyrhizobium sp.]|nr:hypothetical protein CDS [Bradyrhizobium sp.]
MALAKIDIGEAVNERPLRLALGLCIQILRRLPARTGRTRAGITVENKGRERCEA